jgi:hypothetical protein
MKTYWGVDVYIRVCLTSAVDGGEWSVLLPDNEPPVPIGWVDAGLEDVKKKNSCLYRDSNSDPSVVESVASRYTDYAMRLYEKITNRNYDYVKIRDFIYYIIKLCWFVSILVINEPFSKNFMQYENGNSSHS